MDFKKKDTREGRMRTKGREDGHTLAFLLALKDITWARAGILYNGISAAFTLRRVDHAGDSFVVNSDWLYLS